MDQNNKQIMPVMSRNTGLDINQGAVEIESQRAIAEAQGQLTLAKKFPRVLAAATAELMEACKSPDFAAVAFYSVPNRGSGPSIRFAEEVARTYGNFQYGHKELSRGDGKSEIEVYAWDMEKNNRSIRQITVAHVLDTKNGPRKLTDQADIDNKIANVASKQMRGRILALVPKHLVAAGIAECKKTLAGGNGEPLIDRVTKMVNAFKKYTVSVAQIEKYIGHSLNDVNEDEIVDLLGVFNALRDGVDVKRYFPVDEVNEETAAAKAALPQASEKPTTTRQRKTTTTATPTPAPAPTPGPAPETEQSGDEGDGDDSYDHNTLNTVMGDNDGPIDGDDDGDIF